MRRYGAGSAAYGFTAAKKTEFLLLRTEIFIPAPPLQAANRPEDLCALNTLVPKYLQTPAV